MTQTPDPLARTAVEILFAKLDRIDNRLDRIEATQGAHGAMLTEVLRRLPPPEGGPSAD